MWLVLWSDQFVPLSARSRRTDFLITSNWSSFKSSLSISPVRSSIFKVVTLTKSTQFHISNLQKKLSKDYSQVFCPGVFLTLSMIVCKAFKNKWYPHCVPQRHISSVACQGNTGRTSGKIWNDRKDVGSRSKVVGVKKGRRNLRSIIGRDMACLPLWGGVRRCHKYSCICVDRY